MMNKAIAKSEFSRADTPAPEPQKVIAWKLAMANPRYASVRYRCIFPLIGLVKDGVPSVVLSGNDDLKDYSKLSALIIVKSFTDHDVQLAQKAKVHNVPVFLDLCDNIFVDEYGGDKNTHIRKNFALIAECCSAIVTTGPAMADIINRNLQLPVKCVIIHDQIELQDMTISVINDDWWRKDPNGLRENATVPGTPSPSRRHTILSVARAPIQLVRGLGRGALHAKTYFTMTKNKPFLAKRLLAKTVGHNSVRRNCKNLYYKLPGPVRRSIIGRLLRDPTGPLRSRGYGSLFSCNEAAKLNLLQKPEIPEMKRNVLVWFGHHGSGHGQYGITTLQPLIPILEKLNKEVPLKLRVISDNEDKFNTTFATVQFPTEYRRWHPTRVYEDLQTADICVNPNSKDEFSIPKSANRVVMALSLGLPVVSARIPSMTPLEDCVILDNWEDGLREYLTNPKRCEQHLNRAQAVLDKHYSNKCITAQWRALIEDGSSARA